MIHHEISGSDIANKMGWNDYSMLSFFTNFLVENDLEDRFIEYLNNAAEAELRECEHE